MKLLTVFSLASGIVALTIPADSSNNLASRADISKDTRWTSADQFKSGILGRTNDYRRAHGVPQLVWSSSLASYAGNYLNSAGTAAGKCPKFAHTGGPYGENLALGHATPRDTVTAWGEERQKYDWKNPGFSSATGHFTQLVWKATTKVGCQRKFCNGDNGIRGWYVVCEYYPRGNVMGQFKDQVRQNGYKPPSRKARSLSTNEARSSGSLGISAPPSVFMTSSDVSPDDLEDGGDE